MKRITDDPRRESPDATLAIEDLFPWLRAVEPVPSGQPARSNEDDDLAAAA